MDASVIIPTYNRAEMLNLTLTSLEASKCEGIDMEVIISDDGSSDNTFNDIVRKFQDKLELRYVYAPDQGFQAARARNLGAGIARGEIAIFCDCGNIVSPDFVRNHYAFHAGRKDQLVIGQVHGIYQDDNRQAELLSRLEKPMGRTDFESIVNEFSLEDPRLPVIQSCLGDMSRLPAPWALAWTANVSLSLSFFHSVGGFDESYKSWGCEDVDFALSAFKAGATINFLPNAPVIHGPHGRNYKADESNYRNKQYLHKKFNLEETQLFIEMTSIQLNKIAK